MNVVEILRTRAAAHSQRIALIDAATHRTLTYAELDAASARAAASVRARGLGRGDTVLLLHPAGIEMYAALVGLLRAGLVAVVPPPGVTRASLRRCMRTHPPRAVLLGGIGWLALAAVPSLRHAVRLSTTLAPLAHDVLHDVFAEAANAVSGAVEPCEDGEPAMLTFTSGSTGAPKALVRTHGVARAQVEALSGALRLDGSASLCTMPIVLLAELAAGATCVLPGLDLRHPGRVDGGALAEVMREHDVARIVASPALLANLAISLRRRNAMLPALRTIASGGAPVMPPLADALRAVAPNACVVAVYGSTEAEPIALIDAASVTPADHAAMRTGAGLLAGDACAPGSVAVVAAAHGTVFGPFPHDDDVERWALEPGTVGEIIVRGPHVVGHYVASAADATTKIRAGTRTWHRTGDLGYRDARGRIWLVGRAVGSIDNTRGTLEPLRVECALSYLPGIARSAVAGVDGLRVLVVEPLPGCALDERAVREALAFAHIDRIMAAPVPVDPRHDAKVDYAALERLVRRFPRAA
ncbi:MAG TPA: AMP-binding protein [Candidatus Elarobacter sp.]|jgi:acyl-CoA synthetase (AMP-forming)/AMP-acid ligase II